MAGLKLVTNLDVDSLKRLVFRRTQDLGYAVQETPLGVRAVKGSFLTSFLAVSYCDFNLSVRSYDEGNEVALEWSPPWWSGLLVAKRTASNAHEIMDQLKQELFRQGKQVYGEKEF